MISSYDLNKLGKLVSAVITKSWPSNEAGEPLSDFEDVLNHLLTWPDIKHLFTFNGIYSISLVKEVWCQWRIWMLMLLCRGVQTLACRPYLAGGGGLKSSPRGLQRASDPRKAPWSLHCPPAQTPGMAFTSLPWASQLQCSSGSQGEQLSKAAERSSRSNRASLPWSDLWHKSHPQRLSQFQIPARSNWDGSSLLPPRSSDTERPLAQSPLSKMGYLRLARNYPV